jgi:hypothetical protein
VLQCSRHGNVVEIGGYSFTYQGQEYRIQSITPTLSEGYNILSRREDDHLIFQAVDKEQDSILDEVTAGQMSIDEANLIYQEGIREGERRGYIKKRTFAREYRFMDNMHQFTLATYILAMGEVYNRLTITDRQLFRAVSVVVDKEADGILDDVEQGTEMAGYYQGFYRSVLETGMRANRIRKMNGKYLVMQ